MNSDKEIMKPRDSAVHQHSRNGIEYSPKWASVEEMGTLTSLTPHPLYLHRTRSFGNTQFT